MCFFLTKAKTCAMRWSCFSNPGRKGHSEFKNMISNQKYVGRIHMAKQWYALSVARIICNFPTYFKISETNLNQ